jgi:holin-like protein
MERKMLLHLLMLFGFQLAGELVVAGLGLAFPGPLCGMLLLLSWLLLTKGPSPRLVETAGTCLNHLGLLFVPAGTAILALDAAVGSDGPAIAAALVISTCAAIAVCGKLGQPRATEPAGELSQERRS